MMNSCSNERASDIAISGLQYLASNPEQLSRFAALTGLGPTEMRTQAADASFLAGVLEFFMGNEPTLIAFAADAGYRPEEVASAFHTLNSGPPALASGDVGIDQSEIE